MAETTQRRRVTAADFPKREIKLDIVEPKKTPAMPVWYLAPVAIPAVLAFVLPSAGAVWVALAATFLWLGCFGMLASERKRDDLDVGREMALSILRWLTLGLALGSWAFLIAHAVAG